MQVNLDKETLMYLRYAHGAFNLLMALVVWVMLALGLRVRRMRVKGANPKTSGSIHRSIGPFLAFIAPLGLPAGMALILIDKGRLLEYPAHFTLGLTLAMALPYSFHLSQGIIKGRANARDMHRKIGIAMATLYLIQLLLGIGILL